MLLSVSRRTDIPAFYADLFFDCLEQGHVLVPNPINPNRIAKISLKKFEITSVSTNLIGDKTIETKGNIEGVVFWSKNPKPMLNQIDKLDGFTYYFLYTLNAYPSHIESILPSKCIDGEFFEELLTEKYKDLDLKIARKNNKLDGQRKNCGCMPAVDIGRYDTCKHKCNYCYARKKTPTTMYKIPKDEIYERKTELEFEYK